jgi:hypothetical protein
MENPRDSSSGGDIGAAGSGDGADSGVKSGDAAATPGTSNQQQLVLNGLPATTAQELSQLARAAITSQQGASLFAAGGSDGLAGTSAAEQHAALAAGTDSAINALLLNSGINLTGLGLGSGHLNQAALDGLLSGMPAGQLSGAAAVGEAGDDDGSRQGCSGQPSNKQLSSRFRCAVEFMSREKQSSRQQ